MRRRHVGGMVMLEHLFTITKLVPVLHLPNNSTLPVIPDICVYEKDPFSNCITPFPFGNHLPRRRIDNTFFDEVISD